MKSVGIIAEYNPFHNGHKYQIDTLRGQGADTIAVVMSGCFVQRGAPAWTDKYLRTRMALACGADLVFELPTVFALSSAPHFAMGGVSSLSALGVDSICFGSECGTIEPLEQVADFLWKAEERELGDAGYQEVIQSAVRSGISYPAARQKALQQAFPELFQKYPALVSAPNNILSIEYLKAMKRIGSSLHPMTITRCDAGYHSKELSGSFASASAIRDSFFKTASLDASTEALPTACHKLLLQYTDRYPVRTDDFSSILYGILRRIHSPEEYVKYGDISPELAQRIYKQLASYGTISSFTEQIKTKNYTYNRISRCLFQLLLKIPSEYSADTGQTVSYLRLLGMRRSKSSFLRQIRSLPVITKVADYEAVLKTFYGAGTPEYQYADTCFQTDLLAADLYRHILHPDPSSGLKDEYRQGIITC